MIESKLREYKSNLSRLKLIECEIKRLESDMELIDPSYISATSYSVAPKSTTNKFNSIVENAVVEIEKNKADLDELKERWRGMAKERLYLQCKVEMVQAYLTALGAEELFVVEQYFFEQLSEPMIANKYQRQFNTYKNIRTLRRKRFDAIRKMENIARSTKCPQNVLKMS